VNSKYLTSVSVLQQLPVIQSGHIFNPISTLHNPVSDMETERRVSGAGVFLFIR